VTIIFREVVFPLNSSNSEPQKHINFTPEQIKAYLSTFKKLILEDKYTIAKNENRNENTESMENYKIDTKKEKEILLSLEFDDFCYAVDNKKPKFAHEQLFVFCKTRDLDNWGELETVEIYIKTNLTQTRRGDDFIIVISFHKLNNPIRFLFK